MARGSGTVRLDELAAGKLPKRVIDAISKMELTIEEVAEWEASKSRIRVVATEDDLFIETRTRVPVKKLLAVLGSGLSVLWLLVNFVIQHIDLATLQTLVQRLTSS